METSGWAQQGLGGLGAQLANQPYPSAIGKSTTEYTILGELAGISGNLSVLESLLFSLERVFDLSSPKASEKDNVPVSSLPSYVWSLKTRIQNAVFSLEGIYKKVGTPT